MQVYVPAELADAIRHVAATNDVPMSRFLVSLIRRGLETEPGYLRTEQQ